MHFSIYTLISTFLFINSITCGEYVNSLYYLGSGIPNIYNLDNLNLNSVTHINYAFADIKGNLAKLEFNETTKDNQKMLTGHLGQLIQIKQKYRHVKTGLSILGDFGSMVATKKGREEFVNSVVELMKKFGFDYVDLDWEFPVRGFERMGVKGNPNDPEYMLDLLKIFKSEFDKIGFEAFVTIAIPSPEFFLSVYKFNEINNYIKYYHCMTYDFFGIFSDVSNFASNLYSPDDKQLSVDNALKAMRKAGMPKDKMLMGIPAYATAFIDNEKSTFPSPFDKKKSAETGDNGYIALNKVNFSKVKQYYNDTLKASYGYLEEFKMLLSYETTQSVTDKMDYLKENDLKGVMVWALHQDFPVSDKRSLVKATIDSLGENDLEKSQNNIKYDDSPFANVRNVNLKVNLTSNSINLKPMALGLILSVIGYTMLLQ